MTLKINGDFIVQPVQATDNPEEVGIVDMVLVGVKAWQVSDAAVAMKPMVGPQTFVLPLNNFIYNSLLPMEMRTQGQITF